MWDREMHSERPAGLATAGGHERAGEKDATVCEQKQVREEKLVARWRVCQQRRAGKTWEEDAIV